MKDGPRRGIVEKHVSHKRAFSMSWPLNLTLAAVVSLTAVSFLAPAPALALSELKPASGCL